MAAPALTATQVDRLNGVASVWLGRRPFQAMVARNQTIADAVAAGAPGEIAFFEPDAPVYALGRRAQGPTGRRDLHSAIARCEASGTAIVDVDRGGLATLHAPGQIVAFLAVPCERWDARTVGALLLNGVVQLARSHGLAARSDLGDDVGVWTDTGKLASLGLRLRDGVLQHGIAVNIHVDLRTAAGLVLCGKDALSLANLEITDTPECANLFAWSRELAATWRCAPPLDASAVNV